MTRKEKLDAIFKHLNTMMLRGTQRQHAIAVEVTVRLIKNTITVDEVYAAICEEKP